jgi:hypothetical protein
MSTLVTYNILDDGNDRLKKTATVVCNFWNRFIVASVIIVIWNDGMRQVWRSSENHKA